MYALLAMITILFVKFNSTVLEYGDVGHFETQIITKNNRDYLILSGESNSSSLNVKEVKEEFDKGNVTIRVYMTLSGGARMGGAFFYPVKIISSTNQILFGNKKKVIWIRN